MNWQSYEDLVRFIYEELGRASNVKILCHGSSCKVTGKSGVAHQIDVLTEHSDGIHSYKTAIECKYWKEKVNKESVAKLAEILEDAQIEKGVVVSKVGFTPDAQLFAKYKNISIVELREPTEDDWRGRIKDIRVKVFIKMPLVSNFQIIQPPVPSGQHVQGVVLSDKAFFCSGDNEISAQQLIEEQIKQKSTEDLQSAQCEIPFVPGTYMRVEGQNFKAPVNAIRFSINFAVQESQIEINGAEYVSIIMHCIFEEKRFTIDNNGQIHGSEI